MHWLLNDDTVLSRGSPYSHVSMDQLVWPSHALSLTLLGYNPLTNPQVIHCMLPCRWQWHCPCILLGTIDKLFQSQPCESLWLHRSSHALQEAAFVKSTDKSFIVICSYTMCDSCGLTDTQVLSPPRVSHRCTVLIMRCSGWKNGKKWSESYINWKHRATVRPPSAPPKHPVNPQQLSWNDVTITQ